MSGISTVSGGRNDRPTRDGRTASYTGQFGPNYVEKRRRMGPSGRFCRFDNVPQDGDSAGVAEAPIAAAIQHPMPDLHLFQASAASGICFHFSLFS